MASTCSIIIGHSRTQARRDQRAGSYDRKLQTKAGEVTLKVPKLRVQTFEGEPRIREISESMNDILNRAKANRPDLIAEAGDRLSRTERFTRASLLGPPR